MGVAMDASSNALTRIPVPGNAEGVGFTQGNILVYSTLGRALVFCRLDCEPASSDSYHGYPPVAALELKGHHVVSIRRDSSGCFASS